MKIKRIISGGQSGADRAGLDVAIALGIPHGGNCPRGRKAEDGRVPDRYDLVETASAGYFERTALNVISADGTIILFFDAGRSKWGGLTGGTKLTLEQARMHRSYAFVADPTKRDPAEVIAWIERYQLETINIAGPRESKQPGIYAASYAFLMRVLGGAS